MTPDEVMFEIVPAGLRPVRVPAGLRPVCVIEP